MAPTVITKTKISPLGVIFVYCCQSPLFLEKGQEKLDRKWVLISSVPDVMPQALISLTPR